MIIATKGSLDRRLRGRWRSLRLDDPSNLIQFTLAEGW